MAKPGDVATLPVCPMGASAERVRLIPGIRGRPHDIARVDRKLLQNSAQLYVRAVLWRHKRAYVFGHAVNFILFNSEKTSFPFSPNSTKTLAGSSSIRCTNKLNRYPENNLDVGAFLEPLAPPPPFER